MVKKAWWQLQLPQVALELRGYLRHRLPLRTWEHDDLVNETLLALSVWMQRHGATRRQWIDGPATDSDRKQFLALARVILRRRLADRFRIDAREWRRHVDQSAERIERVPSQGPSPERQAIVGRMRDITIGVLTTLSSQDRDLIALVAAGAGEAHTLTPRERQRLKRARQKILDAIVAELGASAAELLRSAE